MLIELDLLAWSAGKEFPLATLKEFEVSVGRDPNSGLSIQDDGISRQHGKFEHHGDYWFFKDLGSTNGSFINGIKLRHDELRLIKRGDLLQLADISLKINYESPVEVSQLIVLKSTGLDRVVNLPSLFSGKVTSEQSGSQGESPQGGRALGISIGLAEGEIVVEGDITKDGSFPGLFALVRDTGRLRLRVAPEAVALGFRLNGMNLTSDDLGRLKALSDRDILSVNGFFFLVDDETAGGESDKESKKPKLGVVRRKVAEPQSTVVSRKVDSASEDRDIVEEESSVFVDEAEPQAPEPGSDTQYVRVVMGGESRIIGKSGSGTFLTDFGKIAPELSDQTSTRIMDSRRLEELLKLSADSSDRITREGIVVSNKDLAIKGWKQEIREIVEVLIGITLLFIILGASAWLSYSWMRS